MLGFDGGVREVVSFKSPSFKQYPILECELSTRHRRDLGTPTYDPPLE
jgi:hypothetical protein